MRTAVYEGSECFRFIIHLFDLVSLGEVRQRVCNSVGFSLVIIDLKIILRELLGPPDLTKTQVLCIYKLMKIVVVSKDKDLIFVTF